MPASRRALLRRLGVATGLSALAGCADRQSETPGSAASQTEPSDSQPIAGVDGSWESLRHDAANTGATTDPGPVERPTTRWEHTTLIGGTSVTPAAADQLVFVVANSGVLYARDVRDGTLRWRADQTVDPSVGPVSDGDVVVTADREALVAHDTETGSRRWRVSFDPQLVGLTVAGGQVIAASDRTLRAVSLTDGSEQWRRETDWTVTTEPVGADEVIAVGLADRQVAGLSPADGTDRWRNRPGELLGAPAVGSGLVVTTTAASVTAFDAREGSQRWRRQPSASPFGAPAVGSGTVYAVLLRRDVGSPTPSDGTSTPAPTDTLWYEATLVALDAADGGETWATSRRDKYNFTSGLPDGFPIRAAGGRVFVNFDGELRAFDATTGSERWERPVASVHPAVTAGVVSTGEAGIDAETGAVRWAFDPGPTIESSPAVVGATAYVGSDDGYCYALDATDGSVQWATRTDGLVRAAPAVDDRSVYVGTVAESLYALDRSDGTEQWRVGLSGPVQAPTVADGRLYVGDFSRTVHAIDPTDGSVRWQATGDEQRFVALTVTVANGLVYAGANAVLRAFDAADGSAVWTQEIGEQSRVQSPSVVGADGLFVSIGDSLRAFDPADGTPLWSVRTGGSNQPPVVRDGTVYAPGGRDVVALDAATGAEQWSATVGEDLRLAVGDAVYGVGFDTPLVALDRDDGSELWQKASYEPTTVPVIADELLVCGDGEGTVSALGPPT